MFERFGPQERPQGDVEQFLRVEIASLPRDEKIVALERKIGDERDVLLKRLTEQTRVMNFLDQAEGDEARAEQLKQAWITKELERAEADSDIGTLQSALDGLRSEVVTESGVRVQGEMRKKTEAELRRQETALQGLLADIATGKSVYTHDNVVSHVAMINELRGKLGLEPMAVPPEELVG